MSGTPADVARAMIETPSKTAGMTPGKKPTATHYGTVVSIQATFPPSLTITVGGSSTPTPGIFYYAGYMPNVGDVVLLEQTGSSFVVKGTLADAYVPRTELWRSAALNSVAGSFAAIAFDTLADGLAAYGKATGVAATAGFLCPIAGRYSIAGRSSFTATVIADRILAVVYKNSAVIKRGNDVTSYSASGVVPGSEVAVPSVRCAVNDLLQIALFSNVARALNTGVDSTWMVVEYLGP